MTDYVTANTFKLRHNVTSVQNTSRIPDHCTAASRRVDTICGRHFGPQTEGSPVATDDTIRYFYPDSNWRCRIDDAYSITSVATDTGDGGTYTQTWTVTTDYLKKWPGGIGPNGLPGWPTIELQAVGGLWFPVGTNRPPVKITGKWGWATVPDAVIEATHLIAHRLFYENDVPSGNAPGSLEFGGAPLRRNWTVDDLLHDYVRADRKLGIAG